MPARLINGTPVAMDSTFLDTSSEFLCIFERSPAGLIFEKNGIIIRLNKAARQLLGYSRKELEGLSSRTFKEMILSDSSDRLLKTSNHTFSVRKKCGRHFWATIKTNFFIPKGGGLATVWVLEDVSRFKEAEIKLHQMSLAVDQSSNSVVVTNTDGIITYANSTFTKITGYSADEVIGKNPSILQSGQTPPHLYTEMWQAITRGEQWQGQFINQKKNGEIYEEYVNVAPVKNEQGRIIRFVATKENITELKKARAHAEKMSRAKGEFLAYMSHEIRTPLNVITGMSELLLESPLEKEQQKFLERIQISAKNLLYIVNDLLDLSKIEAGKLLIEHQPFSLAKLLKDIDDSLSFLAEEKKITFTVQKTTLPSLLAGDRLRLHQILYNLVNNAIKFTREGRVELSVATEKQRDGRYLVTFWVKDSGIGIQKEKLQTIFDSFVQAEPEITRNFGGTGLGLSISQQLVNLMGGTLDVQSVPGLGSTFSFAILLPEASRLHLSQPEKETPEDVCYETRRILLVEDNKGNQELAAAILRNAGHHVTVAEHGLEALELLSKDGSFDIILMDIQMPLLDGLTATICIRKVEQGGTTGLSACKTIEKQLAAQLCGKHVYIIAMTANTMLSDKKRYQNVGIDTFLPKPYTRKKLLSILHNCPAVTKKNAKKISHPDTPCNARAEHTPLDIYERCHHYLLENFALSNENAAHVLQSFINTLKENIGQLNNSILAANRNDIYLYSHKMKGSLYSINCKEAARLAEDIEEKSHHQDLKALQQTASQIAARLQPLLTRETENSCRQHHET
ncbi:MAG: hypothetical protein CSA32_00970 [Desulfobulbus propionicus]|nr:MAG: hypothetical protein CSA32_00970 [Desulfobulbus propionicus]